MCEITIDLLPFIHANLNVFASKALQFRCEMQSTTFYFMPKIFCFHILIFIYM